jgi:hypothetical protein
MDIEYLLYLQQFRETVGSILTPLMNAVTKLSVDYQNKCQKYELNEECV